MTPTSQPRVLDLTVPHRAARIEFDVSPAYEVIATLQALSSPEEWPSYEQGAGWFDDLRSRLSDRLRREIGLLPSEECRAEWAHLAGLVAAAPQRDDVDQVIDHLASLPPAVVYRSLIESGLPHAARRQHAELVEAAAGGDHAARDRLLALAGDDLEMHELKAISSLLDFDGPALRDRIIDSLREMAGLLGEHLAAVMPALRHDIRQRAERVRGLSLEDAVEAGTDGIHYTLEAGIRRVLMVPHAAMRPWVLISEHADTKIFMVAVSSESLTSDLDTPPPRLLQVVKALAEEQRLRILRRLATGGSASLQQIADHIGVAKSTAHHHLVQLRAAGLVVVDISADREFHIREGVGDDVRQLLDTYLTGGAR